MARRRPLPDPINSNRSPGRSLLHWISRALLVLLVIVLGGITLLGLLETPGVANWLAGVGRQAPLVGLIAGHWQNDSGAVCPDGLEEAEINLSIARRVAYILRQQGVRVEVLPEYSPKINGFKADALLSIHSDSCRDDLSGFKLARMTHSADPEAEDRLVELLYASYAEATGLKPHLNTITDDMREYHALRRIAPETPGAIIECGFMGGDRHLLTAEQDRVAAGIANGLMAFLRERTNFPNATTAP
ncbi:MAG: N-acetylmuramoyl-L-alanine amidase [Chloroflexi bacterium]|nr:N-acetylmuramoyl-L-alanine amidase [Chloroflexota bacterium]